MQDSLRARFDRLAEALAGTAEDILAAHQRMIDAARRDLAARLNHSVRQMQSAPNVAAWREALLDAVQAFSTHSLLFSASREEFQAEGARNVLAPAAGIPFPEAPALRSALDSGECVVAARVPSEVSASVAQCFAEGGPRLWIAPLPSEAGSSGLVVAASVTNTAALELLTLAGGAALRTAQNRGTALVGLAAGPARGWDSLPRPEQELHMRAQRFARVRVAEMQVYHGEAAAMGQSARNIYTALKPHVDAARSQFAAQFMSASATMVDYLHLELVRTLAANDDTRLGIDYPGPLA